MSCARCFAIALVLVLSLAPCAARAEDAATRYGARGSVAVLADMDAYVRSTSFGDGSASRLEAGFEPGADWFFVRDLSIGLEGGIGYSKRGGAEVLAREIGPRVGYNAPFGARSAVSWNPRVAFTYGTLKIDGDPQQERGTAQVFAPIVVRAAPRFFFGGGPLAAYDVFAPTKIDRTTLPARTTFGARVLVGTFWGGESDPEPAAPEPPRDEARFGDAGHVVFTGAVSGGILATSVSAKPTRVVAGLAPGADVFVAPHVSIGGAAAFVFDSGISQVFEKVIVASGGGRVGVDVPLGGAFSLWPRASLVYSHTYETTGSAADERSADALAIGLDAPVLVHAPHAFLGLGPSVGTDLVRSTTPSGGGRTTDLGASAFVGGWL